MRTSSSLRLSLARASRGAVGLSASGGGTVAVTVGLAVSGSVTVDEVGKRGLAHAAKRLASSRLAALLVGGEVEGDEKDQVRAENSNT